MKNLKLLSLITIPIELEKSIVVRWIWELKGNIKFYMRAGVFSKMVNKMFLILVVVGVPLSVIGSFTTLA